MNKSKILASIVAIAIVGVNGLRGSSICICENTSNRVFGMKINKVNFTAISGKNIPNGLSCIINLYHENKSALYLNEKGCTYLAVFSGKKNVPECKLTVTGVEYANGHVNVVAKDVVSQKKSSINKRIIYPYAFIKFNTIKDIHKNDIEDIYIKINSSKIFKAIDATKCIGNRYDGNKEKAEGSVEGMETIKFETLSNDDVPSYFSRDIKTRGIRYIENNGYIYLGVYSGQKSSGGYRISVVDVKENKDGILVMVKEDEPTVGSRNIQVLTYPYVVIRFKSKATNIIVKTVDGKELKTGEGLLIE